MKKRFTIIAFILGAAVLLFLTGYGILFGIGAANKPLKQIQDPDTLYNQSAAAIANAADIVLTISKTQETTVNTDVFLEISQQVLSYSGLGTQNMRAGMEETLTIGSHSAHISEVFTEGIAYAAVNEGCFSSQISSDAYQARFAPGILLTPALYDSISGIDTGEYYIISFAQPSYAESWALNEDFRFIDANGTAYVSYDGQLTKSIYALTYQRGNAQIRLTYTVEAELTKPQIEIPPDTTQYVPVSYLDGAKMLERTSGYLVQAKNVSSHYSDSIYFQAFGDARTQDISIHTSNESSWSAVVNTQSRLTNDSRVDQETQLNKTELFTDNTYRVKADGSAYETNTAVTADDMYSYCQNLLVGTVMLPQYITDIQMEQAEDSMRITFSANEAFAMLVSSNTCNTLYQKPELLNELAQSSTTEALECYLELDSITGLPTASGISYSGTYTVDGLPYSLQFKADQIYNVLSQNAQEEISKAAGA